jgi:hypothetical protein
MGYLPDSREVADSSELATNQPTPESGFPNRFSPASSTSESLTTESGV